MDKILQGNDRNAMQVTNDGATILKAIGVDNPAAKILVGKKSLVIFSRNEFTEFYTLTDIYTQKRLGLIFNFHGV